MDAILYVKKMELTPSVFNAINTVLNDKTPKVFTVPRGQQYQHIDNPFLGEIPKHIAICMKDNHSYNGNCKNDSLNCQHHSLTQIGISVNGEEVLLKPFKLHFHEKLFVTAYNTLFSGTGKLHRHSGSITKREDYLEWCTIIIVDLTPFKIGDNFDPKAEGTLSIDLIFNGPSLSQLLSTYWFMQHTTMSLKLIATITLSKIGATDEEHLSVRSNPYERSIHKRKLCWCFYF